MYTYAQGIYLLIILFKINIKSMKVSLMQENLAKALLHINKAVSTRPNIPVLANVLIEVGKGMVKLSATNLEMGISMWIGANISEEGKLTVSAKLLSDFVNSLKP